MQWWKSFPRILLQQCYVPSLQLVWMMVIIMEMKPWRELAFPERKESTEKTTSSPSGTKLHYKSYKSLEEKKKETENKTDKILTMINKEQTQ